MSAFEHGYDGAFHARAEAVAPDRHQCVPNDAPPYDTTSVDPSTVDLVLEMTATYDADGFQEPARVTRSDVVAALLHSQSDIASAVDEILSLLAVRSLQMEDTAEQKERDAQLQWHELCQGLGISECDAFMKALDDLPEHEKNAILSTDGGFLQQLLLELDEEEQSDKRADQHPLEKLQALYPNYSIKVIEDVLEQQNYDVSAAADALYNLRGINKVQSFAAVVSAQTRAAEQQRDLQMSGSKVESLGHFPDLPGGSNGTSGRFSQQKRNQKQRRQQFKQQHQLKPSRLAKLNGRSPYTNAWERQDIPASSGVLESTISSELKIDRLKKILPSIGRGVIQTVSCCCCVVSSMIPSLAHSFCVAADFLLERLQFRCDGSRVARYLQYPSPSRSANRDGRR